MAGVEKGVRNRFPFQEPFSFFDHRRRNARVRVIDATGMLTIALVNRPVGSAGQALHEIRRAAARKPKPTACCRGESIRFDNKLSVWVHVGCAAGSSANPVPHSPVGAFLPSAATVGLLREERSHAEQRESSRREE